MTSIVNENISNSLSLNLSASEYSDFLRCLTNLKEICNDVDIRNGIIRQRSNDKTSVFELDMTPIIPGVNIAISDIKKKLDLLKTFAGQEVSLEIKAENDSPHFIFSDTFSSLKFISPSLQYIDNKFMELNELENIFVMNEDDLILEHDLTSMITDRIRVTTLSFNTESIQVNFLGELADIKAATQAKDQFAKFVTGISTNVILEGCSANLSTIPFSIEHDTDVEFKMFKDPQQDISLNRFATTIGDINIMIYTRSSIVKDE